jgi:hypothetical protein
MRQCPVIKFQQIIFVENETWQHSVGIFVFRKVMPWLEFYQGKFNCYQELQD